MLKNHPKGSKRAEFTDLSLSLSLSLNRSLSLCLCLSLSLPPSLPPSLSRRLVTCALSCQDAGMLKNHPKGSKCAGFTDKRSFTRATFRVDSNVTGYHSLLLVMLLGLVTRTSNVCLGLVVFTRTSAVY